MALQEDNLMRNIKESEEQYDYPEFLLDPLDWENTSFELYNDYNAENLQWLYVCNNVTGNCTKLNYSKEDLYYYNVAVNAVPIQVEQYLVPFIFGLIFIVGIVGNSLVVYVIFRNGAMKTVTNLYLMNLAVADLLFLTCCVPFTVCIYILPYWPFGDFMCKVVNYLMTVTMAASVFTLMIMGIDRYYAVTQPLRSRAFRNIRFTIIVLTVTWSVSLIALIPVAFITRTMDYWVEGEFQEVCVERWENPKHRPIYTMLSFVGLYIVPLGAIAFSYYRMVRSVWTTVMPGPNISNSTIKAIRSRRKVAKMVLVIVVAFAVCWLPIHYVQIQSVFDPQASESSTTYVVTIVAQCMSYLNSAINPFIYAFLSENFRKCFKMAFRCRRSVPMTQVFFVQDPEAINPRVRMRIASHISNEQERVIENSTPEPQEV